MRVSFDQKTFDLYLKSTENLETLFVNKIGKEFANSVNFLLKICAFFNTILFIKTQKFSNLDGQEKNALSLGLYGEPLEIDERQYLLHLIRKHKLSISKLTTLSKWAYEQIISFIKAEPSKNLDQDTNKLIFFLENSIDKYLPYVYKSLTLKTSFPKLSWYRKNHHDGCNTVCWHCGTKLRRKSPVFTLSRNKDQFNYKPAHCYRSENPLCARRKIKVLKRTKQLAQAICSSCRGLCINPIRHRINNKTFYFCTERHYESMRKRINRNK